MVPFRRRSGAQLRADDFRLVDDGLANGLTVLRGQCLGRGAEGHREGERLLALSHLLAGEHVEQLDGFEVGAGRLADHGLKLGRGHRLVDGEGEVLLDGRERGDGLRLHGLAVKRAEQRGKVQLERRGVRRQSQRLVDTRVQLSDHADDLFARDDLRSAAGVPLRGHILRGGLPQLVTRTQTVADTANGLDGVAPIDGATIAEPSGVDRVAGQQAGDVQRLIGKARIQRGKLLIAGAYASRKSRDGGRVRIP